MEHSKTDYDIIKNQNKAAITKDRCVIKTNLEAFKWLNSSHRPMQPSTATQITFITIAINNITTVSPLSRGILLLLIATQQVKMCNTV